eukprot:c20611_g1_i2 orf=459-1535(+)
MKHHSALERYHSAPSSLLASYLEWQDWNDFSGSCLGSSLQSEGPVSVYDGFPQLPTDVKPPGISEYANAPQFFSSASPLDIYSLPELPNVCHQSRECELHAWQQTADTCLADDSTMLLTEAHDDTACISTSNKINGFVHNSWAPGVLEQEQLLLGIVGGDLGRTHDRKDSIIKESVLQKTAKSATSSWRESGIENKITKSRMEGELIENEFRSSTGGGGSAASPFLPSLGFAVESRSDIKDREHISVKENRTESFIPLLRSSSFPALTRPKSVGLENASSYHLGPCQARAKRGCATHPRSIAERLRRTRISEKMRKLHELVPNMATKYGRHAGRSSGVCEISPAAGQGTFTELPCCCG